MKYVYDILEAVKQLETKEEKIALLKQHASNTSLRDVISLAYDRTIDLQIREIPDYEPLISVNSISLSSSLRRIKSHLITKLYTGEKAILLVVDLLSASHKDDAKVLEAMFLRELDLGLDAEDLNQVWKDIVPSTDFTKTIELNSEILNTLQYPLYATVEVPNSKLVFINCKSEVVTILDEELNYIKGDFSWVNALKIYDTVFKGYLTDEGVFHLVSVFDNLKYSFRLDIMELDVSHVSNDSFKLAKFDIFNNKESFLAAKTKYSDVIEAESSEEGYSIKRNKSIRLRIKDAVEGILKASGQLGVFVLEDKSSLLTFRTCAGISEENRAYYWQNKDDLLDKIASVSFAFVDVNEDEATVELVFAEVEEIVDIAYEKAVDDVKRFIEN